MKTCDAQQGRKYQRMVFMRVPVIVPMPGARLIAVRVPAHASLLFFTSFFATFHFEKFSRGIAHPCS
jgi:hypothetical protein